MVDQIIDFRAYAESLRNRPSDPLRAVEDASVIMVRLYYLWCRRCWQAAGLL